MIDIQTVEHIDRNEWNDLLAHSPTASYFQSPECYDFYQSLSFLKPFGYGVSENGELKGIVTGYVISDGNWIKRYLSRRAIIPGGALLSEGISDEALNLLLKRCVGSSEDVGQREHLGDCEPPSIMLL